MKARNGKIAALPKKIREELNRRLDEGERGGSLLRWLNGLPEVKKVLKAEFGGEPMNKNNLSRWRREGFEEWRREQVREERILQMSREGIQLKKHEKDDLFEEFGRI